MWSCGVGHGPARSMTGPLLLEVRPAGFSHCRFSCREPDKRGVCGKGGGRER